MSCLGHNLMNGSCLILALGGRAVVGGLLLADEATELTVSGRPSFRPPVYRGNRLNHTVISVTPRLAQA